MMRRAPLAAALVATVTAGATSVATEVAPTTIFYSATRAIIDDAEVASGTIEGPAPDAWPVTGWRTLDEKRDVTGALALRQGADGALTALTYDLVACLPCQRSGLMCQSECYALADSVEVLDYSGDGREYRVKSLYSGAEYPIHVVRRESDPSVHDPSAILYLTAQAVDRRLGVVMIYRLEE